MKCVRSYTNKKELLERKTLCSDNSDIWYLPSYATHFLYIPGVSIRNMILVPFLLFNWYFGHNTFSSLRTKEFLCFIRSEVRAVPWLSSDNDNPTECKKSTSNCYRQKTKRKNLTPSSCQLQKKNLERCSPFKIISIIITIRWPGLF